MAKILDKQQCHILSTEVTYCEPSEGEIQEENYFYVNTDSFDTCTPKELIELCSFLIEEALLKL